MTVKRMMKENPITTTADASIVDVADILKANHIHRLPVLDKKGKLIGVITEKDILHATPSPVSSLSVYEMPYMLSRLKVSNLMQKPKSITPDITVEEAAKIMIEDDLSCLPVVEGDKLVGIVSKSDMFKVLYELFGSNTKGVRVTFVFNDRQGEIAKLSSAITSNGLDIISIGTFRDKKLDGPGVLATVKIATPNAEEVLAVIRPIVKEILDVRVV